MPPMSRTTAGVAGLLGLALLVPAGASGATLDVGRKCFVENQPFNAVGTGWVPGSVFAVGDGGVLNASGVADGAGNWATQLTAPLVTRAGTKPKTVQLAASQNNVPVASTSFKVVNFQAGPKSGSGNPRGRTKWRFSGFSPGKRIWIHVKRGKRVWRQKAGRGSRPCGTLKTRLRRLPAVPSSRIRDGKYKVFIDNRKKLRKGGRQQRGTVTVF